VCFQYTKEDAAQSKKSYEDKYGSKVSFPFCSLYLSLYSYLIAAPVLVLRYQGSKAGAKGAKGAKAAAKEELYIDSEDAVADVKPEAKGSGGRPGSKVSLMPHCLFILCRLVWVHFSLGYEMWQGASKEVVWSKEDDYF
jgi:hypothetical protein